MGYDATGGPQPTGAEKERFLKKIAEWRELGFKTDDLEDLLENDFDEFLRRRHLILKQQIPEPKPEPKAPTLEEDISRKPPAVVPEAEKPEDTEPKGDELLLLGEPLAPDTEAELEPEEEGVIIVGKLKPPRKSKIHRTREEEVEEETPVEITFEAEEEEELEEEEEELEGEEEEELEEEEEGEEEIEPRKVRGKTKAPPGKREPEGGTVGGRIAAAAVIIILFLAVYYFGIVNPLDISGIGGGGGGGEEDGAVTADFVFSSADGYYVGTIITLDASNSTGKNLKYSWTFDNSFQLEEGTSKSKIIKGYFTSTENIVVKKSITLRVSNNNNEDSITKEISLSPRSFKIEEERLNDNGEFKVTGSLDINNPDGITKMESDDGEVTIHNINLKFRTRTSLPMTMELNSVDNEKDGFQQSHSVYERTIGQNLVLSGTVSGEAKISSPQNGPALPKFPFSADLNGNMVSTDKSYTDFKTHNVIYAQVTNKVQINVPIKIPNYEFDEINITSDDVIESYPDLRKNPMKFRVEDLSDDELQVGYFNVLPVGSIVYYWRAEKVEYVYERPVIKVNISVDNYTKTKYGLQKFFSAFWIAEEISQPVKAHLYSVQQQDGNTITLNYISEMTDFNSGLMKISSQTCDKSNLPNHFYSRRPGHTYEPSSNWSYLPPTGESKKDPPGSSFDGFTHEQALALANNYQPFIDYIGNHPDAYVVTGYCTASGEGGLPAGVLTWNLTFGEKSLSERIEGFNIVIPKEGEIYSEDVTIDAPPNSTSDFEPLLTFASSEDVLLNYSNKEFFNIIFTEEDKIDFDNVEYGVETNLQYPNLDITSIWFVEHSKYSYKITYEQSTSTEQRIVSVALDAETGQLLFYWNHKDNGLDIPGI